MTPRSHLIFWASTFAFLFISFYALRSVLLPFALGIVLAYLLNPLVNALSKKNLNRNKAALLILVLFFSTMAVILATVIPVLYREIIELSKDMPSYLEKLSTLVSPITQKLQNIIGYDDTNNINDVLTKQAGNGFNAASGLIKGVLSGGLAALNVVTLFIITPFVTFFMVREWVDIKNWVRGLLPRDHKDTIVNLLQQIDVKISGFIRGQIIVAFILGIFYAAALTIAGLKYGFLIGLGAGILCIIPMVGSVVGLITSVAVAWFQTGDLTFTGIIAGIFLFGQLVEGNFLTPKLVGDRVGLHPLWVFFALMAGGGLFGILGMLVAVPVAAIIGVMSNFAIQEYKKSAFYKKTPVKNKKKTKAPSKRKKIS